MTENRNGFVVEAELRQASGMAERETAKDMVVRSPGAKRLTVGADKGFDTADFVADMRDFNVTPHVAQNTTNRLSAIDHRTTRHCGHQRPLRRVTILSLAPSLQPGVVTSLGYGRAMVKRSIVVSQFVRLI